MEGSERSSVDYVSYLYWKSDSPTKSIPILLVHGVCGNAFQMRHLAKSLSKEYNVFAIDLPGHGESKVFWKWLLTISDHAVALATLCREIERITGFHPILIGHSMGAWIVDSYLCSHKPADVPATISMAATPLDGLRGPTVCYARKHLWRFIYAVVTQNIKNLFSVELFLRYLSSTGLEDANSTAIYMLELEYETLLTFLCMLFARSAWELETICTYGGSRLNLVGENDNLFPASIAKQDAESLKVYFESISRVGHGLIYPGGVSPAVERISDFLERVFTQRRESM